MKAAFLTSSLIAPKGKASPASPVMAPRALLDEDGGRQRSSRVSRIYDRVREAADHHEEADVSMAPEETTAAPQLDEPHQSAPTEEHLSSTPEAAIERHSFVERSKQAVRDNRLLQRVAGITASHTQEEAEDDLQEDPAQGAEDILNAAANSPAAAHYEQIADEVSKLKRDGLGRIRISVRMVPKDHLRLKLIAAHTQMSAQSIFEAALEEYVANHGAEILPQTCACILDKTSL
ncbi:MAG: hypothetical protein EP348_10710 [Alphaproteobacteria bacterium]|nr:MAG: hypothetical protein EP348_10710 [Alphaproteobacteria bacterium]